MCNERHLTHRISSQRVKVLLLGYTAFDRLPLLLGDRNDQENPTIIVNRDQQAGC